MKYSGIGGQAVIEGIMMKNKDDLATAVRRPDGMIEVKKERYVSITEKVPFLALPFIRGVFSFADSMILGMRTLSWSAGFFEDDEDSEPGRFELWLDKMFGEQVQKVLMAFVMVFSVVMAVIIFMLFPLMIANLCRRVISSGTLMAILEGLIRIAIFIAYIKVISRMEDIRRTFMYHGAEHKCINCIEHGMTLTVDHVRASSRQHKRCGTSFLIIVMIISILFFMVIRVENIWLRFASRIVLIPVIAGVSYEFLRLAGRSDSPVVNFLSKPGMWMQGLTTSEPDDSMIEVAITAVETVFDWRAYLRENFPETEIPEEELLQTETPEPKISQTKIPQAEIAGTGETSV
ncbi:MAG: DUF1385 domain-containing protein [Clostridiales bacterium]|nr:DUF1385 domain-containing protein [Clostridiales bacterium]